MLACSRAVQGRRGAGACPIDSELGGGWGGDLVWGWRRGQVGACKSHGALTRRGVDRRFDLEGEAGSRAPIGESSLGCEDRGTRENTEVFSTIMWPVESVQIRGASQSTMFQVLVMHMQIVRQ